MQVCSLSASSPLPERGFTLLECTISISVILLLSVSLLAMLRPFIKLNHQTYRAAQCQADMGMALELMVREAREGQLIYAEKLPNAAASLLILDDFSGRTKQIRYRLTPDVNGSFSLLREIAYPGYTGYQGHNPVARSLTLMEITIQGRYLELSLEGIDGTIVTQGTALRNLRP